MADNYLEYKREEYERRKAEWLRKRSHKPLVRPQIEKPEDESL